MKKMLFATMAAICLMGCDGPTGGGNPEEVFYATDSIECEVRGVFEIVDDLVNNRREVPNKRYALPPPRYAAIVAPETTYLYNWQAGGLEENDIMAKVAWGDTVHVRGTVRTLTNGEGKTFQDIIVDSILEITPTVLFRYTDTVENAVIQGRYRPNTWLKLSDYADYLYPCICLPKPNEGYPSHPYAYYYINPEVNFKFATERNKYAYLCGVYVQENEWVEVMCDLITGLTVYDEPYWWVNMKSAKVVPTPEQYK